MSADSLTLMDILDINHFQELQDSLSISTDMALLTVDYKGVPVTEHSECRNFCKKVRKNIHFQDLCQKCDSRGGLEAARQQKPYIYICHMGIVDLAVPIIADGGYLGAMMAGQVRIDDDSRLETILNRKSELLSLYDENDTNHSHAEEDINKLYEELPIMSYEKIEAIGRVLFGMSKVLVDRALLTKNYVNQFDNSKEVLTALSVNQEHHYSSDVSNKTSMFSNSIKTEIPMKYVFLKPAIEFIHQHINDKVYLEEMAILCNVSESYFSKCFNKAFDMSFTTYQTKLKLQMAEELLKHSSKNVNQISDELGFDHASYFIRVFKKMLGVTPAMYKQLYIEKTQLEYKNQYNQ